MAQYEYADSDDQRSSPAAIPETIDSLKAMLERHSHAIDMLDKTLQPVLSPRITAESIKADRLVAPGLDAPAHSKITQDLQSIVRQIESATERLTNLREGVEL